MVSFTRGAARWWLAYHPPHAVPEERGSEPMGSDAETGTPGAGPVRPAVSLRPSRS